MSSYCRHSGRARCISLCDKVCQLLATGWWFSLGPPVSSTNKTERHDITKILFTAKNKYTNLEENREIWLPQKKTLIWYLLMFKYLQKGISLWLLVVPWYLIGVFIFSGI
jgi:hypothetical protein